MLSPLKPVEKTRTSGAKIDKTLRSTEFLMQAASFKSPRFIKVH
jgi:hypothetical protein